MPKTLPFSMPIDSAAAPGQGGTREVPPRFASSRQVGKVLVLPRLMRRFVKVSNHNGEVSAF